MGRHRRNFLRADRARQRHRTRRLLGVLARTLPHLRPDLRKGLRYPPEIVFAKVDTAQITSVPTLMAFREGILVFSQPGALPAAALEQVIAGVRGLDMERLRARTAKSQTADATLLTHQS